MASNLTWQKRRAILQAVRQGHSHRRIRRDLRTSASTIDRLCKRYGVRKARSQALSPERRAFLLELLRCGYSGRAASEIVGCNRSTAAHWVHKLRAGLAP